MDVDMDNQQQPCDAKFHLPALCVVCSTLDSDDNELLTEFVVNQVKTNSLTSTVVETTNFYATVEAKNLARGGKNKQVAPAQPINAHDIEQHILYCIATRMHTVGKLVCTTIVMKSMLTAESPSQVLASAKLLLQTQNLEKQSGG